MGKRGSWSGRTGTSSGFWAGLRSHSGVLPSSLLDFKRPGVLLLFPLPFFHNHPLMTCDYCTLLDCYETHHGYYSRCCCCLRCHSYPCIPYTSKHLRRVYPSPPWCTTRPWDFPCVDLALQCYDLPHSCHEVGVHPHRLSRGMQQRQVHVDVITLFCVHK